MKDYFVAEESDSKTSRSEKSCSRTRRTPLCTGWLNTALPPGGCQDVRYILSVAHDLSGGCSK